MSYANASARGYASTSLQKVHSIGLKASADVSNSRRRRRQAKPALQLSRARTMPTPSRRYFCSPLRNYGETSLHNFTTPSFLLSERPPRKRRNSDRPDPIWRGTISEITSGRSSLLPLRRHKTPRRLVKPSLYRSLSEPAALRVCDPKSCD